MMGLLGGEVHMQLAGNKQKEVRRFAGIVYLALALLLFTSPANALSEKKELELGKQLHAQVIASSGIYPDPSLQQYVNDIGQKLAAVADRNHLEFRFFVLDDDLVNAMALPGGYIYVTRGLIAHLNSEAQLAAVIGHETHPNVTAARNSRSCLQRLQQWAREAWSLHRAPICWALQPSAATVAARNLRPMRWVQNSSPKPVTPPMRWSRVSRY
jgi:predicted Zn-dependent protease